MSEAESKQGLDGPPFRADHVGSCLRPKSVLDARARRKKGEISCEELKVVEDAAIADLVKIQADAGLVGITDGEYRREFFHVDFLKNLQGVAVTGGLPVKFRNKTSVQELAPPKMVIVGRLERNRPIAVDDFKYLKSHVDKLANGQVAKLCIPSPTMLHFRAGRQGIDSTVYPDIEDFFADLSRAYREEIHALAKAGCTYLQLDDTNLAYLCDPAMRERTRAIGEDPDKLPKLYAKIINDAITPRPEGLTVCVHLCRGNHKSSWVAEGGYEPVAKVLFNDLNVDGYFLEYDDERSGDFEPLRHVPKGKRVVLGLVSSKLAALEDKESVIARIHEAAKYCPLDQLAVSPQCGFSSTVDGNDLTHDDQAAKMRLCAEIAKEVWG